MSLFVKICGVTDQIAARAAHEARADAIGLVFAESVRQVSTERAADIVAGLPRQVTRIAVFRKPDQDQVDMVLSAVDVDVVQADHDSPFDLPPSVGFLPVCRDGGSTPAQTEFLYEGRHSGTGERADWERARDLAREYRLILAGGLGPDNVADAIGFVRPHGVDVSSGVETSPGVKSPALIHEFVEAARGAESALSPGSRSVTPSSAPDTKGGVV